MEAYVKAVWLLALCASFAEAFMHNTSRARHGEIRSEHKSDAEAKMAVDEQFPSPSINASFLRREELSHRLRVCNAYASTNEVEVFLGNVRLTDTPMPYKTCRELPAQLQAGDRLQFKVGTEGVSSFAVNDLPSNDAVLLLVIYRHDALTDTIAFESHVFANLINAQIAVLDTYKGKKSAATPSIKDVQNAKTSRKEELRYDSVVAVNPGLYEVVLPEDAVAPKNVTAQELVALNRESYLVLRVGMESDEAYPEDLLVFPHSDPKALTGAAFQRGFSWQTAVILMLVSKICSQHL